ncbi:MAG: ferritin family protein [Firmicutes bacterium]|nr:ferritin family protein [Bacillota bacterium]
MNIFEYAINMEIDGEQYYRDQAEKNRGNGLFVVCNMLADDERGHAAILRDRLADRPFELVLKDGVDKEKNVFSNLGDIGAGEREVPGQLEFYRLAAIREQESIALYSGLKESADCDGDVELFDYLISQEEEHYRVLGEIIKLLQHAEDWVESAEFGNREDY